MTKVVLLLAFATVSLAQFAPSPQPSYGHYLKVPSDACLRAVFNTFQKVNSLLCWEGVYHLMPY